MAAVSSRLRILLIDDCPDNAQMLATLLAFEGYSVETLQDPRNALEAVLQFKPDTVLLDMAMPGMNGCQVAQLLRSNDYQRPIVAISGYADEAHKNRAAAAGIDHYLVKPVSLEDLSQVLERPGDASALD